MEMDMTGIVDVDLISGLGFAEGDSAFGDDTDDDAVGGDDMDMTEAVHQNIIRKRSLSVGGRAPLSTVPSGEPVDLLHDDLGFPSSDPDQSYADDNTASTSTDPDRSQSQPLEYTVPLIKPPAPPSDVWLALRSVTHSGDTPYEAPPESDDYECEQGMDLTDAVQRLMVQRQSLGFGTDTGPEGDSFASTNDGLDEGEDFGGDQTVNFTGIYGRPSIGGARPSMSAGTEADSTMDITAEFGPGIVDQAGRLSIAPTGHRPSMGADSTMDITAEFGRGIVDQAGRLSLAPLRKVSMGMISEADSDTMDITAEYGAGIVDHQAGRLSIAPPRSPAKQPTRPVVFSAPSPAKINKSLHAPQTTVPQPFNFSFAPRDPSPQPPTSPSKAQPSKIPTPIFSAALSSPKKRKADDAAAPEIQRPSPAKKMAVANSDNASAASVPVPSPVLSPSKNASTTTNTAAKLPVRRPSSYFARRQSIGVVVNVAAAPVNARRSPKKAGRMSIGHSNTSAPFNLAAEQAKARAQREERLDLDREATSKHLEASPPNPPATSESTPVVGDVTEEADPTMQAEQATMDEESPAISVQQFFNMTGIKFMDEITAPRRSTIHPSVLQARHLSRSSAKRPDSSLAEYVNAVSVDIPQLRLYSLASKDLQVWLERSKANFQEAEAEAEKLTPELFSEFMDAGEDGQAELVHHLKILKVNSHASAKSGWYDWKLQWVESLYAGAEEAFDNLAEVCGRIFSLLGTYTYLGR